MITLNTSLGKLPALFNEGLLLGNINHMILINFLCFGQLHCFLIVNSPLIIQGTPAKTGKTTPLICGENAGQHIYLDGGAYSTASASLALTLTGATARKWKIKVVMIYYWFNIVLVHGKILSLCPNLYLIEKLRRKKIIASLRLEIPQWRSLRHETKIFYLIQGFLLSKIKTKPCWFFLVLYSCFYNFIWYSCQWWPNRLYIKMFV